MSPESNRSEEIGRFEAQYRQNPDSLVFARLADAYRKAGDPDRGLSILEEGIGRHPDYPSAHIVRARCLVDLERPADAEASLRRVLELDGQNLVAMRGLAGLAERRGDPSEAMRWYEQIAALDPMNVEAETALERLRPATRASPPGIEPLPAPREEWWSSPVFQVEAEAEGEPAHDGAAPDGAPGGIAGGAWWFEDPSEDDPSEDGDLLTRTMADLYVRQGLHEEAAAIYRELLSDRPDDEGLRRALDDAERRIDRSTTGEPEEPAAEVEREEPTAGAEPAEPHEPTAPTAPSAGAAPSGEHVPEAAGVRAAPFVTHPVPQEAGTSDVFLEWLRRLGE